jgi:hypothetical protein
MSRLQGRYFIVATITLGLSIFMVQNGEATEEGTKNSVVTSGVQ